MSRKQTTKTEEQEASVDQVFPEQKEPEEKPDGKEVTKSTFTGYVHIDTFLSTARTLFNLPESQVAGFKAYMSGKSYLYDERDFIPYLEKYLGKELNI